ncbi:MAG: CDP-alcohol phosphatidyltransferase family protein [Chloroflexota bacterium]
MTSRYRYLIPNAITFFSLACGVISILSSATGYVRLGGILILTSYILDLFDGEVARRLKAGSAFGLQLDSLVDMVSMGTAPAVLVFFHLQGEGFNVAWAWPFVVMAPLAGAFRLARFNLGPAKTSDSDSMGLTISTAGATLTLAVLSDLAVTEKFIPNVAFILLLVLLTGLMVSRIAFPPFTQVIGRRRSTVALLALFAISLIWLPFVNTWFLFTLGFVGFGLARAGQRVTFRRE